MQLNRNAQRFISISTPNIKKMRRNVRPNNLHSPRRSSKLQMKRAHQGMSQPVEKKRGGTFSAKSTLPFNPDIKEDELKVSHVYSLLEITGVEINTQV
jgi:hypothetical protein